MKLQIPTIGKKLQLSEAWNFTLHAEYRNVDLLVSLGLCDDTDDSQSIYSRDENGDFIPSTDQNDPSPHKRKGPFAVQFPIGTVLTMKGLYLPSSDDSINTADISFSVTSALDNLDKKTFWVRLEEANCIHFIEVK